VGMINPSPHVGLAAAIPQQRVADDRDGDKTQSAARPEQDRGKRPARPLRRQTQHKSKAQ